ncbi:asparagine synthase (glutamine-hydrolyzing) [soil metagenome]
MCGIAGIVVVRSGTVGGASLEDIIPEVALDALEAALAFRGPDGRGRFRDRARRADGAIVDVALVHRRLAIIDAPCGAQPMVIEDPAPAVDPVLERASAAPPSSPTPGARANLDSIVFNGCIYNHRILRTALEAGGERFATDHSDTEALLRALRRWGPAALARLDGMYAAAWWSRATATLTLIRDPFGEKPLTIRTIAATPTCRVLAFASTAAALHHPAITALLFAAQPMSPVAALPVDMPAVADWVRFGWGASLPVRALRSLPVGAFEDIAAPIKPPRWSDEKSFFWHRRTAGIPRDASGSGSAEPQVLTPARVDSLLRAAVVARLDADVPIGVFLSGGIDSSLIAAHVARLDRTIPAFTLRMPDPRLDESSSAAAVARHLGLRHIVLDCPGTAATDLVTLIEQLGLPFGDSSLLPTHWLCKAARASIRVALVGDGGDELFAGYQRHQAAEWFRYLRFIRPLLRLVPASLFEPRAPSGGPLSRTDAARRLLGALRADGYADILSISRHHKALAGFATTRQVAALRKVRTIAAALAADQQLYLPEDLCRKTDTAAMAVALEVRSPLLAPAIAAAANAAPPHELLLGMRRKGLLRETLKRHLPDALADGPKRGFALPVDSWYRDNTGDLRHLLLDHLASAEPFGPVALGLGLDLRESRRLIAEHDSGKRQHGQRLHMILVWSIWTRWLGRVGV